jgi:hypothetical protein
MPPTIVLDANLLVLLVVGMTDEGHVGTHKRTRQYTVRDYNFLRLYLEDFTAIAVTPSTHPVKATGVAIDSAVPELIEGGLCGGPVRAVALPIPGQQLVDALCGMILDAREDIGEPGLRVDVVELGGLDQRVDRRSRGGGQASRSRIRTLAMDGRQF